MRGVSALAPKADIPCGIIALLGGFNGLGGVPFCATGYYSGFVSSPMRVILLTENSRAICKRPLSAHMELLATRM